MVGSWRAWFAIGEAIAIIPDVYVFVSKCTELELTGRIVGFRIVGIEAERDL